MRDPISPLRYPGGKACLASYIECFILENRLVGTTLYEPYAGGASVSLTLLERNVIDRCVLVERDPLIYAFWKAARDHPHELARKIKTATISVASWQYHRRYLRCPKPQSDHAVAMGFAGLFLNRCNFSGILGAGPIGGIEQASEYEIGCRFDRHRLTRQLDRIAKLRRRISVRFGDGLAFLRRNAPKVRDQRALAYIDPPYVRQGSRLYRYFYTEADHRRLATYLDSNPFSWLVSYDDHPLVYEIFSRQEIVPILLNYAVKQTRHADELLISNLPLPEPLYRDGDGQMITVFTPAMKARC
jgi:DNA adenine methylase